MTEIGRRNLKKALEGIKTLWSQLNWCMVWPVEILRKPWKGLKRNSIILLFNRSVCRNLKKALEGIKTFFFFTSSDLTNLCRNLKKALEGIKTERLPGQSQQSHRRNLKKALEGIKTHSHHKAHDHAYQVEILRKPWKGLKLGLKRCFTLWEHL